MQDAGGFSSAFRISNSKDYARSMPVELSLNLSMMGKFSEYCSGVARSLRLLHDTTATVAAPGRRLLRCVRIFTSVHLNGYVSRFVQQATSTKNNLTTPHFCGIMKSLGSLSVNAIKLQVLLSATAIDTVFLQSKCSLRCCLGNRNPPSF